MYSDWVGPVPYGAGFLAVFIWLWILTYFIWQQRGFLKSLFPKSGERDIRAKFEEVLQAIDDFDKKLGEMRVSLSDLRKEGFSHIGRFWLLRYNPYEDTGGDQSFSAALLDGEGNGFVLTSLHARSATRVFAKPIEKGLAGKYRLSKEEEEVVKKAMEENE